MADPRASVHFPETPSVTQFFDPTSPRASEENPPGRDDVGYLGERIPPSQVNIPTDNESGLDDTETEDERYGGTQISADLQRERDEANEMAKSSNWRSDAEEDSDEGGTENIYAVEYMLAWAPLRYLIFWTFPFNVMQMPDDGSYLVHSALAGTFNGLGFLLSTIFSLLLFFAIFIGLFSYFLDHPTQSTHGIAKGNSTFNGRAEEVFLLHRNFPTIIMIVTSLFHIVVGNMQVFWKRTEIAEYLTFWTEALQIMKIHSTKGVFFKMLSLCFIFSTFLLLMTLMGVFRISPMVRGGPGFIAHICFRVIWPDFFTLPIYPLFAVIFGGIFLYIIFAAKIYVFLYMFKCIILRNTFSKWNERLDCVVNRDDNFIGGHDRLGKRTGFKELYQDHVVLMDLMDGADMMFGETIESYFSATTFSICFECFYLWRALTNTEEFSGDRALDAVVIGLYLLQTVSILFMTAILSSDVADVAMEGMEVLRRKGYYGRKTDDELYFLMSLYSSYCGPEVTAISGAGYFVLDQSFIVTIIGTFLSYVIILFQFNPPMEFQDDKLVQHVLDRTALLKVVEGP